MSGSLFLLKNFRAYKLFSNLNPIFSTASITTKSIDTKKSNWQNFYENYIRFPELKNAQETVLKVEKDYLESQNEKNQCWQLYLSTQSRLKDIHAHLDPLPTIDSKYPQLLDEEVQLLKKIRSLSLDFNLYDRLDREKMAALSEAIAVCVKAEKTCERRAFRLLIFAILCGLTLTFILNYIFYRLYLQSLLEKTKTNNSTLKDMILQFNLWIEVQNKKIKSYLEDLWKVVGLEKTIPKEDFLLNPELEETDGIFIDKCKLFHELSCLENESTLHEMISFEETLLQKKEFLKLPTLYIEKDENELSDKGLWATTFGYGSAAILVPLAFFLLA